MSICVNCQDREECIKKHQALFDNYQNLSRTRLKQKNQGMDLLCRNLKKEVLGRGKTAGLKQKTYPVDFLSSQDNIYGLNDFQKDVFKAIRKLSKKSNARFMAKLILDDLLGQALTPRENQIYRMCFDGYNQTEIAKELGVSQPRVHYILSEIFKKLRCFAQEDYKSA